VIGDGEVGADCADEMDVGLIGAIADAVLVTVLIGGHVGDPQARSVGQQPPPRLAGHD